MILKIVLSVTLASILLASLWFASQAWLSIETNISSHGWIAMGLGIVLSLIVGVGLMALVFYSSRQGYDDIDHEL